MTLTGRVETMARRGKGFPRRGNPLHPAVEGVFSIGHDHGKAREPVRSFGGGVFSIGHDHGKAREPVRSFGGGVRSKGDDPGPTRRGHCPTGLSRRTRATAAGRLALSSRTKNRERRRTARDEEPRETTASEMFRRGSDTSRLRDSDRSINRDPARWSSLVARRAHNPKVVGSNPARATMIPRRKPGVLLILVQSLVQTRISKLSGSAGKGWPIASASNASAALM
jgi:hypothetical protein